MLINFFFHLKTARVPVSIREYLMLLEGMQKKVIDNTVDEFYLLSRATLVKDERNFDKFDRAFGSYFKGIENIKGVDTEIPMDWLKRQFQREFSAEEKAAIEAMGGLEKLMERMKELLEEQKDRHEGGKKWIGTNGTSPFGNGGFNPEGIRVGGPSAGNRTGVKVWEQRAYRDYDDQVELGTRNIKVALRRLRKFARSGAEDELDLDNTIHSTARNAGYLDIKMRPERRNAIKVLMLLDVGGTMDDHIKQTEELFSAAKTELKHLEVYYFHNCVYDFVWKHNRRRHAERHMTWDIIRKYNSDYRLIFVGDATMSPYEILQAGGSVEYNNEEAGAIWLNRLIDRYPKFAWLNPEPEGVWDYRQSVSVIKQLMANRMYPVTLQGLERAMRELAK
jgi:uncharacterized protein